MIRSCFLVIVIVFVQVSKASNVYPSSYPDTRYQVQQNEGYRNTSAIATATVFKPRDSAGGGGGSLESSYAVPVAAVGGFSGGAAGGGYEMSGGYGAPMAASPMMYKYQLYPNPAMESSGWGAGGDDDDDLGGGDFDFPKEIFDLIGLKGYLKGLKGFKGLKGKLALLKLLLLLKKLLKPVILPFLFPILLPLKLIKLGLLLLPLILILFLPVITISGGRFLQDNVMMPKMANIPFIDELNEIVSFLPQNIANIAERVSEKSGEGFVGNILSMIVEQFIFKNNTSLPSKWVDSTSSSQTVL